MAKLLDRRTGRWVGKPCLACMVGWVKFKAGKRGDTVVTFQRSREAVVSSGAVLTASYSPGRNIIKLVVMAMHVGQSRHERVHLRQLNWIVNRPRHDYV